MTVITTCHNQGWYIDKAIESVAGQQTDADVFQVVCDDGSDDDSLTVLRGYEAEYPHLRVMRCTNRNPAGAFNAALLNVKPASSYVVPLCGDDWLAPNFVEECLSVFRKRRGLAAVVPGMRQVGGRNESLRLVPQQQPTFAEVWAWDPPRMWTTAMIRKQALLETGGFHPAALGEEDWDMWIDLSVRGYQIGFTDRTWFYYRVTPDGLTARKTRAEWDAHRAEIMRHHKRDTLPGPDFG